jgi:hypothetical protein
MAHSCFRPKKHTRDSGTIWFTIALAFRTATPHNQLPGVLTHLATDAFAGPRRLALLLALVLPWTIRAQTPTDKRLCQDGFLQVVSPDAGDMTQDQCRAVTAKTLAAWRFAAGLNGWSSQADMEKHPLTERLISVARMKTEHPGVLGFSRGANLFVVSLAVLEDPFANGTLAHELAHIQAYRAAGSRAAPGLAPRYFIEGHGLSIGRSYRDHLGVLTREFDTHKAAQIAKVTAADAQTILTDNTYGSRGSHESDVMESMGIFFVEYLRVRYRGGLADVVPRMARVFEALGGGQSYTQAFQQQFGAPITQVVADVVGFVKRTESNPVERLRATRYQDLVRNAKPPR